MIAHLIFDGTRSLICWLYRLFGFLLGTTLAGASVYYYILEEYKVSNELLTEDIYVRSTMLLCSHPASLEFFGIAQHDIR